MKRKEFQAKLESVGGDYEKFRKKLIRWCEIEGRSFERKITSFRANPSASKILFTSFAWSMGDEGRYWYSLYEKLLELEKE